MDSQIYSDLFANEAEQFKRKSNLQAGEAIEKCSYDKTEAKKWNDCNLPSQPSILIESCSSESIASSIAEESKQCSSVQAKQVSGLSYKLCKPGKLIQRYQIQHHQHHLRLQQKSTPCI